MEERLLLARGGEAPQHVRPESSPAAISGLRSSPQRPRRRFNHFKVDIEDLSIHFLHHRSTNPDAVPLILLHGWSVALPLSSSSLTPRRPGSFLEFLPVIPLLTSKFHLVIPSQPGFAFSSPPATSHWKMDDTARVFDKLMTGLGYATYAAQGGDWGSITSRCLGALHGDHCKGESTFARSLPPSLVSHLATKPILPQSFTSISARPKVQDSSSSSTRGPLSPGSLAASSRTSSANGRCARSSTSRRGVRTMLCSTTLCVIFAVIGASERG